MQKFHWLQHAVSQIWDHLLHSSLFAILITKYEAVIEQSGSSVHNVGPSTCNTASTQSMVVPKEGSDLNNTTTLINGACVWRSLEIMEVARSPCLVGPYSLHHLVLQNHCPGQNPGRDPVQPLLIGLLLNALNGQH